MRQLRPGPGDQVKDRMPLKRSIPIWRISDMPSPRLRSLPLDLMQSEDVGERVPDGQVGRHPAGSSTQRIHPRLI